MWLRHGFSDKETLIPVYVSSTGCVVTVDASIQFLICRWWIIMIISEINMNWYFLMRAPKAVICFPSSEREITLKNLIPFILRNYEPYNKHRPYQPLPLWSAKITAFVQRLWLLVGVTGSAEISQRDACNFGSHLQAVVKDNFVLIYNFQ